MGKTFLIIAFFLFFKISGFSQEQETYFKGKDLKKYQGKWIGVHDKDTLILILQYKEHFDFDAINANLFVDAIIGWHCYKRNGVTESCNITNGLLIFSNHSLMILKDIEGNQLASLYERYRKNGSMGLSISLHEDNPDIMIWEIKNIIPQEGVRVVIKGDTIPKYTEDDYPESKLTAIKEWKLMKVKD